MSLGQRNFSLASLAGILLFFGITLNAQEQKPSQQPAQTVPQEQAEYTEEEYDAYEKATQEKDLEKRGQLLIAFMEKYPKSKLMPHITPVYQALIYELHKTQQWAKLMPLAERWLKDHPEDLQALDYVAAAAQNLGDHQKFLVYAQKVFAVKPTKEYAYFITQSYKKLGDEQHYFEWSEKCFPYFPENFALRMEFVDKYVKEKNFAKTAEYAQLALKSLEVAKKPESTLDADWRKWTTETKRSCYYFIAMNYYGRERWSEALRTLGLVLAIDKRFAPAYYYSGHAQWKMNQVEEAIDSFAKVIVLEGENQAQAKEYMEKLYMSLHNKTLIGVDKVYRKARQELGLEASASLNR